MPAPPRTDRGAPEDVLRRLEVSIAHLLDGLLHGDHGGLVPGQGSDLGESRRYEPGDDVRRIDWNVTARLVEPHVRETIADRELETWAVVDLGASMDFGTANCEKRDLAISAASACGFLTARTGNRFGTVVIGSGGSRTTPARGGRRHLLAALHRLLAEPRDPGGAADLDEALTRLAAMTRRRGLAVVISDFLPGPETWERALRRVALRHEVIAVEVIDPLELALPPVGTVALADPVTGRHREVRTSAAVRRRYQAAAREQREAIAAAIRGVGADHLVLRTDSDWLFDIVRFVEGRRERTRALRASRMAR